MVDGWRTQLGGRVARRNGPVARSTRTNFRLLRLWQEIRGGAEKPSAGVHSQKKVDRNGVILPRKICLA